jgi:hypothetical protein
LACDMGGLRRRVRVTTLGLRFPRSRYGRALSSDLLTVSVQLMKTLLRAALLVAAFVNCDLHAQQSAGAAPRPRRVPVTVVMLDTLASGTPFRILRRTEVDPRDVIVLRSDADSATLSAAVHELLLIRSVQGDTARSGAGGLVRVRPHTRAPGRTVRMLPWGRRVVDDVRAAQSRAVAGVGTVRAVQIWLPPQRGRGPAH